MNKSLEIILIAFVVFIIGCKPSKSDEAEIKPIARFAFGSCAHEDKDQPMLKIAADLKPDAFIFLGDNIYGDSRDMSILKEKYNKLGAKAEFQELWEATEVHAIWDDHDFGENDAGRHYPFKEASKEIFMDFWKIPEDSSRRNHEGIYGVENFDFDGFRVQLIMLDTRTFRDELVHRTEVDSIHHKNDYMPNQDPDSTFLGQTQWMWLEDQLSEKADLRIIASSNQFSHEYNGWESWTNVPHEQQKMIDLIQKTKSNGIVFISGDVHWGEISKMQSENVYPIYDVTSSGITETWDIIEPNNNRIGNPIPQNNIGLIEIFGTQSDTSIVLSIIDLTSSKVVSHSVSLNDIKF